VVVVASGTDLAIFQVLNVLLGNGATGFVVVREAVASESKT